MNQEKIIQAIADVINKKGTDDFGMLPWCKPSDLIAELAAAIAPHLEAGAGWEDAPSWAEYIATDWNGQKHWFEKEPYKHNSGCWFNQEGTKYQKINYSNGDKWDISFQQRPR